MSIEKLSKILFELTKQIPTEEINLKIKEIKGTIA
jgi:hypothetical protein